MSGSDSLASSIVATCLSLAAAGPSFDPSEMQLLQKLVCVLAIHFARLRDGFLSRNQHRPILASYQSDATSFLVRSQLSVPSSDGSFQRRGRLLSEFLSERAVYKSLGADHVDMVVVMKPPRILGLGKKTTNLLRAACDFMPVLRLENCTGILVVHTCFDRAVHDGISRLMRARGEAYYSSAAGLVEDEGEAEVSSLKEWFLETGCAAHDGSGGLKWGLARWSTEFVQDNLYISIESLRNTFSHLASHLGQWLGVVVTYTRHVDDDAEEKWWRLLGVPADWVDDFVAVAPRWSSGQLHCRAALQDDPESFQHITRIFLWCMRWTKFSMTRWLTVGISCRAFLRSLSVGIVSLMQFVRDDPSVSDYHAHGFAKCGEHEIRYTIMAALASYPTESWLAEIILDDRIAGRAELLQDVLVDELNFLEQVPESAWERLSDLLDVDPWHRLRHGVLSSAHICVAYLSRKTLKCAIGYPWRLCRGDIKHNLEELRRNALPANADSTTKKIKAMLELSWPVDELIGAVKLFSEVGWTSKAVEDMHGSIAVVHRLHKDLDGSTLALRAFVHACRALFRPDVEENVMRRLIARCDGLDENRGRCVSGQNMFFADMISKLKVSMQQKGYKVGVQQALMKKCNSKWASVPPSRKQHYHDIAVIETEVRLRALEGDRAHARAHLDLQKARTELTRSQEGARNILSSCRFSDLDFKLMEQDMASPFLTSHVVDQMVASSLQPPASFEPCDHEILESFVERSPVRDHPAWLKLVCHNRLHFNDCILLSTKVGEEKKGYLFVFATQSPMMVSFMPLFRMRPVLPLMGGGENQLDMRRPTFCNEFRYDGQLLYIDEVGDMPFEEGGHDIEVVSRVEFFGYQCLVSDDMPVSFAEFSKHFEPPSQCRQQERKFQVPADVLEAHPWLKDVLAGNGGRPGGSHGGGGGDRADFVGDGVLKDEDIDLAWEALYAKREEWEDLKKDRGSHFVVNVRGGRNTMERKGVAYDCVSTTPRGALPMAFCIDYGLQRMHSFSIHKFGERGAMLLASEVAMRYEYFFGVFMASDTLEHVFSVAELEAYTEGEEWRVYIESLEVGSELWTRAMVVRALRPRKAAPCLIAKIGKG